MEEQTKDLSDYLHTLRRRRKGILTTGGVILLVASLFALLLPPVYQSSSTILIEEQEIPPDLIRSTITTYAWQRIQTISQRVMTRSTLLEIVDKYNLYHDKRKSETSEEIIERLRSDIKMVPISADVIDPQTGRPMPATIAFTVAFQNENPEVTQKVTNELTTLYLNENLKSRTERAAETVGFLTDETEKLAQHIGELEEKLAEFKKRNVNQLPELSQMNMLLVERTDREITETSNQINNLEERKLFIEGQLASMSPSSPMFSASGERILDSESRLKIAKTDLAAALARYAPDHPDVVRLRREVEGLEAASGGTSNPSDQAKQLTKVRSELASAREKYSEEHPDVIRLNRELAALEAQASQPAPTLPETALAKEKPDNPVYVNFQLQLRALNSELQTLANKRATLKAKLTDYESRLAQTPLVEKEYLALRRDYENAQIRYREIKNKQMVATVGEQLEKERKGERFSLIEPPQLPEKPIKPNRIAIMILGLLLSIGGGIGYGLAADGIDKSIRSARGLAQLMGAAPLSVIPYAENSEDINRRKKVKKLAIGSAVAGVSVAVILIQILWIPWDVLWYKGMRVISTLIGG